MGQLERRPRRAISAAEPAGIPVCESPDHRRGRTGQQRSVGIRAALRVRVGPGRGRRLGAVSLWPLGVGALVWMDLGQLRPVGLGAVSLRPLVLGSAWMVLVSGWAAWIVLLEPCAGGVLRLWTRRVRFRVR